MKLSPTQLYDRHSTGREVNFSLVIMQAPLTRIASKLRSELRVRSSALPVRRCQLSNHLAESITDQVRPVPMLSISVRPNRIQDVCRKQRRSLRSLARIQNILLQGTSRLRSREPVRSCCIQACTRDGIANQQSLKPRIIRQHREILAIYCGSEK